MAEIIHHLWYTEALQEFIGEDVVAVLESWGLTSSIFKDLLLLYNREFFLPDHTLQTWLVMAGLILACWAMTRNLKTVPDGKQNILEMVVIGFRSFITDVVGPDGPKHLPFMASVGIYIFFANLVGLFPFCMSPTSNLNITIGCALLSFMYYHIAGIRKQGVLKYLGHFFGPKLPWYMFVINLLMFVIEMISHLARPLSLAVRLFGNIMGEDIVIVILLVLVPILVPMPMMAFAIFTSFLQAFIFTMLSMVYVAGAVAEEH
jgi:F-type H+-transporting ATPase subunit a